MSGPIATDEKKLKVAVLSNRRKQVFLLLIRFVKRKKIALLLIILAGLRVSVYIAC